MTTLDFFHRHQRPKEKSGGTLWNDASYRQWTSVFREGSYAESDWEEGSKTRFLTPTGEGMYGIIQKKMPFEQMVFEHKGEVKNGIEEKKDRGGATEGYLLTENNGVTKLGVKLNTAKDFASCFEKTISQGTRGRKTFVRTSITF